MLRQDSNTSSSSSVDPPSYQELSPPSYEEPSVRLSDPRKGRPTLVPASDFNANWDAVNIKKALKVGDKKAITNILCKRSSKQRTRIVAAYKTTFNQNLIDEIKTKINGNVKSVFISLLMSIPDFYCWQLRKTKNDGGIVDFAMTLLSFSTDTLDFSDGDTGNDDVLIEIMCAMSNGEIRKICAHYQQIFGKRLEQGIREDKMGNFKKLLVFLADGNRDESATTDLSAANADAEILKKNFEKILPDELPVVELLCSKNFAQIKLISEHYKKLSGSSLEKSIKKNFSDSLKDALVAIVRISNNPSEFYARRINKAINNYILDGRSLGRLIVARCEIDLLDIKEEFNRTFRKTIKSCLKHEISGSYKYALLTLLGDN